MMKKSQTTCPILIKTPPSVTEGFCRVLNKKPRQLAGSTYQTH
jgi:hypothetical protein